MYSKTKHRSGAPKRKDKRKQGDVTAKLNKLDRFLSYIVLEIDSSSASPPSLPSSSTSEAVSWPWLCDLLLQPARRRGWIWLCQAVVQQFPQGPQPIGDSMALLRLPDAKIKSYIIATGLCRPTGPFPRDKHQGNRFNPLLSSLCRRLWWSEARAGCC